MDVPLFDLFGYSIYCNRMVRYQKRNKPLEPIWPRFDVLIHLFPMMRINLDWFLVVLWCSHGMIFPLVLQVQQRAWSLLDVAWFSCV